MGFRGRRQAVEGWGDGVIVLESMQIRYPQENWRAAFSQLQTISSQSSLTLVAPESQACMIWRTVELNASLTFSYSRSIFLFSWVVQSVNCFSHFSF